MIYKIALAKTGVDPENPISSIFGTVSFELEEGHPPTFDYLMHEGQLYIPIEVAYGPAVEGYPEIVAVYAPIEAAALFAVTTIDPFSA